MKITGIEKLDTLNKMITLRGGEVPFDVVFLIGSIKDINKAIDVEREIIGLYVKETAVSEGKGVYFTDLKNAKSILSEHKFKSMNVDVTGICPSFDYETFISQLGLEGVTEDLLDSLIPDDLKDMILLDIDSVVMDTLLYHYEHHDDNRFYEDDFNWFKKDESDICPPMGGVTEAPVESKPEPASYEETFEVKEEIKTSVVKEALKDKEAVENEVKNEEVVTEGEITERAGEVSVKKVPEIKAETEKKPTHGAGAALLGSYRNSPVKKDVKADPLAETEEEDEDAPLKPETVVEKKKPSYIVKDKLTDEEEALNREQLRILRGVYSEGIRFIQETCNSQYRIILNKMTDALEKNIYKTQFCPMYLEISEDRRSPLYHKLYEIDMATINFQKKVIHQVINIGCAFCNKTWQEEITFLSKGPHFVSCPSCYSERGFEKE